MASLRLAVWRLHEAEECNVEVYVVINDDVPSDIAEARRAATWGGDDIPNWLKVEYIVGHGNVGYGAAQNLALAASGSDVHVFLNPDVFLDVDALVSAVRFLREHTEVVVVAPQAFDSEGHYARLAKRDPSLLVLLVRALPMLSRGLLGKRMNSEYTYGDSLPSCEPRRIRLASGCFMCCRAAVVIGVGGFDPEYFLYFEDFDLSRRLGELGQLVEVPGVRIVHLGGNTARRGGARVGLFLRSAIRYFRTYGWRLW